MNVLVPQCFEKLFDGIGTLKEVTAVVQDATTKEILKVTRMDGGCLLATLQLGVLCYVTPCRGRQQTDFEVCDILMNGMSESLILLVRAPVRQPSLFDIDPSYRPQFRSFKDFNGRIECLSTLDVDVCPRLAQM